MTVGHVLGVDFGTSNSAAGLLREGAPHLVTFEDGARTLPTTFFFDFDARETLLGAPAAQALIDGREGRFMRALKRVLGTPIMHETRAILNERVTFVEIIARFLKALKAGAEAETGLVFERALSGRPVHFHAHDPERDARAEEDLRACYLAAGFRDVSFMLEPAAAAVACGARLRKGARGLIVDIGGGTSDFSVFATGADGEVEIIANHGARVGGTDFDRAISIATVMPLLGKGTQLRQEMGPELLSTPNAIFNDLATWEKIPFLYTAKARRMASEMTTLAVEPEKLKRLSEVLTSELGHDLAFAVERGKIAANTDHGDARIDLGVVEPELVAMITPSSLEGSLRGFVDEVSQAAEETLRRANCSVAGIDQVIYVGGSSLISFIPAAIKMLLPNAEHEFSEVFTAVADGLAIASASAHDQAFNSTQIGT